jgi:MFS family permease
MPFLMADLGFGPAATGTVLGISALSAASAALLLHRVVRTVGIGDAITVAVALISGGYLFFGFGSAMPALIAGGVVSGFGIGLFIPGMNVLTVHLTDPARRGRAVAGLMTCLFLGQFVCPYVSRPVAEALGRPAMFQLLAGAFAVLSVVLAALRSRMSPGAGAPAEGVAAP